MPCSKYKGAKRRLCYATDGWKKKTIKVKRHRRKGKIVKPHYRKIKVKKKSMGNLMGEAIRRDNLQNKIDKIKEKGQLTFNDLGRIERLENRKVLKRRMSLFHAGDEPPSERIKRGEPVYGFSSKDFAEGWKDKKKAKNIYQFQTDRFVLDPQQYSRTTRKERKLSDNEFIAGNVLDEKVVE